ncbi:hypothetical protein UFOVP152_23 [uncultured Caudovirales phage]|uniref:Uncharacterized protein n=1 Tax=uncultured Caudovirales phage TaxID=2100421 RepID=A0A6J7W839_9CAUD|nr:hypothetical protein UFOVP152_23 [uncultured Caudovirales phage]
MSRPFLILSLSRSRTAWLSRFLTYGEWICGHEELRHARSLDDVRAMATIPCYGSAESVAAPWWRLFEQVAPGLRVVIIRRPVADVVESYMALGEPAFDRTALTRAITRLDAKLDQVAARYPDVLSVDYADLEDEATCARVFEHCLPYRHDHAHWSALAGTNIQCDVRLLARHYAAYRPAIERFARMAKGLCIAKISDAAPVDLEGMTIEQDTFEAWTRDGQRLFLDHIASVGEEPHNHSAKNWDLMARLYQAGAMQIMAARSNGRMFGYLVTLITPSLGNAEVMIGTNTAFYADPACPGLGAKLQRASLKALRVRGVDEVVWEAGKRGSGPRLGSLYRRLGAAEHGQTYRLELSENA